jgi:WD40 repeat protein
MNLSNINSSINEHKSKINQIKENINDLINRVNKSKTFCFTPNLCYADKIFGELKLNETITKLISGSDDTTIKIWDLKSFECLQSLNGHNDSICQVENLFNN